MKEPRLYRLNTCGPKPVTVADLLHHMHKYVEVYGG